MGGGKGGWSGCRRKGERGELGLACKMRNKFKERKYMCLCLLSSWYLFFLYHCSVNAILDCVFLSFVDGMKGTGITPIL